MFVNNCLVMIAVTFVRFCRQDEVMPSRSKTVYAVTVEVWKKLLQDMMLIVHDALEQTFVGVLNELSSSGVIIAIQAELNTATDQCIDALFVGSGSVSRLERRINLAGTTALYMSLSASTHIP